VRNILLSALLFTLPASHSFASNSCIVTNEKVKEYLAQDFNLFDQTLGAGHRELGLKECYVEEANIIDVYHLHHQDMLETWQSRVLYFHAGQSYAQSDASFYSVAIKRFEKSFNPEQPQDSDLAWNEYVHATVAFLQKDMKRLVSWRDKAAQGRQTDGNKINLRVIDAMIQCFDKPYRVVYSPECIKP
jgi:hypothetical protein